MPASLSIHLRGGDEPTKSAGESANRGVAESGKFLIERRIGDDGIDRDVQLVDNLLAGNCSQATDAVHCVVAAESAGKNPAGVAYWRNLNLDANAGHADPSCQKSTRSARLAAHALGPAA